MDIAPATDARAWDSFLTRQRFSPFLQSWTMGEVYRSLGQEPVRLEMREGNDIVGICFGHVVPARRGRHVSVPYGPVFADSFQLSGSSFQELVGALKDVSTAHHCSFIRMSPFLPAEAAVKAGWPPDQSLRSPLHLLGEHVWYLSLRTIDLWSGGQFPSLQNNSPHPLDSNSPHPLAPSPGGGGGTGGGGWSPKTGGGGWDKKEGAPRSEDDLFKAMRATTRNLIRRAQKEGVTVTASTEPMKDLDHFLRLHDETRKRHGFTPYTDEFFRSQLEHFASRGDATLYLAWYKSEVIASSIHMHVGGETSYHHGASTHRYSKIPASYVLQWTAIRDALKRGDSIYSFWGIAPINQEGQVIDKTHPFAGVTLFKTGFGGRLLNLVHCFDIPISKKYYVTRAFEFVRKWRRGF